MQKKIAIVGFAFRLPGGNDAQLWEALCEGRDLVTRVESSRWAQEAYLHPRKSEPGCSYTFAAGSVGDVKGFDAAFFGISPREASQMDPQQRFLLEMAWEATEDAGIKPSSLRGSRCAVYIGYSGADYPYRLADDLAILDSSSMTGNAGSVAANRISYFFDLRGPSIAVDTACSSSLVALHQACLSIRSGEVDQALVGGITLHLHPYPFVGFAKATMLSARGVCSVFDAAGDGYVRSEGGGIFMLKALDRAIADGNRIHAVILGSGVNCDGKTNGMTVPGMETQADLLREVYAEAGVTPSDLDYLEAHGTGTAVGDPIEAAAISDALAKARPSSAPLKIGSIKSNLGHLETAAGIAGLVKLLYCLRYREIPPTIHLRNPNPNIDFLGGNIEVVTQKTGLPDGKVLHMGVNSFGFGGVNAHVLLASAEQPAPVDVNRSGTDAAPLVLSAKSPEALRAMAGRLCAHLKGADSVNYYDVAYTYAQHREALEHRFVTEARSLDELGAALGTFAAGKVPAAASEGVALPNASRPVFVFSGNGSQWFGMGRKLLDECPEFAAIIGELDPLFRRYGEFSPLQTLRCDDDVQMYDRTEIAQPALFAIQVGITRLLRDRGVTPAAVVGHSVGEVAAAWASGALSLAQAIHVILERSAQQGRTRGAGAMTAVGMSETQIVELRDSLGLTEDIVVAGVNSAHGVTLAGSAAALLELERRLAEREIFQRRLPLEYAFHSPAMDPIKAPLLAGLEGIRPKPVRIPFYSTVSGERMSGEQLHADYWWQNVREPVRFQPAISALIERHFNVFVEIGPHAVLRNYIMDCLRDADREGRAIPTMMRTNDGLDAVTEAFFQVLITGSPVDASKLYPRPGRFLELPRYPWQHEAFWHPVTAEAYDLVNRHKVHPLLGYRLKEHAYAWQNQVDTLTYPALQDHVVGDAVVFPAAGFVEMALAASECWKPGGAHDIEELEIRTPLLLDEDSAKTVRLCLDEKDGSFVVESKDRLSDVPWSTNVVGRLAGRPSVLPRLPAFKRPMTAQNVAARRHYELAAAVGLDYGEAFRAVLGGWLTDRGMIAEMHAPASIADQLPSYHLHPAFIDGCFQLLVDLFAQDIERELGIAFVPVKVGRVLVMRVDAKVAYAQARLLRTAPRSVVAEFVLYDAAEEPIAVLQQVRFRGIQLTRPLADHAGRLAYRLLPSPIEGHRAAALDTDALLAAARKLSQRQGNDPVLARYRDEVEPLLDVLCASFAEQALRQIVPSDQAIDIDDLIAQDKVAEDRRGMLQQLVAMLEDDGLLEPTGEGWRWCPDVALPDPPDIWVSLIGDYPDHAAGTILTGRVGMHLHGLLTGCEEPGALTPDTCTSALFSQHVESSPALLRMKGFASGLLARALANLPAGRRLRVLELAACATRLGSATLVQVDFDRCDYTVCAASQDVLDTYEGLFERYPGIERKVIDLDASSTEIAEAELGRFDLVLACDTLAHREEWGHLLRNLGETLLPGGLVLFLEPARGRWSNLVASGSSARRDSAGGRAPRLSEQLEGIREACLATGFEEPEILYNAGSLDQGPQVLATRTLHSALTGAFTADNESKLFVVFQGHSGYASALATNLIDALESAGHIVVAATPGKTFAAQGNTFRLDMNSCEQLQGLLSALLEGRGTVDGIVHLFGLDPEMEAASPVDHVDDQAGRVPSFMHLLQACHAADLTPDIWVVTSGAAGSLRPALAPTDVGRLADAPLWGFARTAINEFPDMAIRLIDLAAPQQLERMASGVVDELLHPTAEDEIVLTADGRFVPRLQSLGEEDPWAQVRPSGPPPEVQLDFRFPGPLKHLLWRTAPSRAAGPTEVAIEVRAAGLNFRDVMYAMGLLSEEAVENGFAGPTLGMELAGVVTQVGARVTHVVPGDEVIAFAPASFATRAVTQATAVVHKPADWSFAAAATVPTTFFTAYYALYYLARLTPGERVLIHGAAGGVGIAAVQLAKYLGAEVFATAGSDEKRDFVRLLGADHVMNSRSLAFADEILEVTNGDGVDVVLNSLAGEAMSRNFKVLRPFGRFLELGKRDYYENTRIGLRPFRNNIAYYGIDADQLMAERPELAERLFKELMGLFEAGHLKPLPFREFPAAEAVDAFRYMQQSKQIGKVVLSFEQRPRAAWVEKPEGAALQLSDAATYLVTGGLSGFGATTAEWLAAKGARHLVVLSRRGATSEEGRALVERLTSAGVDIRAYACDVTDAAALGDVFAEIQAQMPPLRGVVHAAMVIADDLIRNMDEARVAAVFAPKIKGALNLHQLTGTLALDFFVLYSSATALFGNPGQANYVAANYYLEALAAHRRACGLPAICVGWGPIDDVGYLARNQEIKQALQSRMGGAALTSATALTVLEQLLLTDATGIGVFDVDWTSLRRFLPSAEAPRYARLAQMAEELDAGLEGHDEIERLLEELSTDELTVVFVDMLKKDVGDILRIAPERIDEHRSVYDLGMDSLMGMELIAAVEARFGVQLPIMALSEGPTMARLAERIIKSLSAPHGEDDDAPTIDDEVKRLVVQHGGDVDERLIDEIASELKWDKQAGSGTHRH